MSDITQTPQQVRPFWIWAVVSGAFAANVFGIVVVNYWIYYARAAFIATHPAYVAVQPPTISRAISDPVIGIPFAFWISVSAVTLVFGVACLALIHLHTARIAPFGSRRAHRIFLGAVVAAPIAQIGSGIGMYILSNFRFPEANAMHMVGSYTFFVAQGLVILAALIGCLAWRSSQVSLGRMADKGTMRSRMLRLRIWVGYASIGLTVGYILLFAMKNVDIGAFNAPLYTAYVLAEPVVISSFLLLLALFQTDFIGAIRRSE
jgi:hypothetical protein